MALAQLLHKYLTEFMDFPNGAQMCKDATKASLSGMSHNEAFSLPESWGGWNCLLPVVIHELKVAMGGDELLEFTSVAFSE
jgi:hypothetical protein